MPLRFKIDILQALKDKGYTTYRLQQSKLLANSTIQKLRDGGQLSWSNIETICKLLQCQPGDIIEYVNE
jgi:putative transcriptional regulator